MVWGLYKVDFTSWRKSSVQTEVKPDVVKVTPNTSDYLFVQYANLAEIPSYKIKVIGLGDNVLKKETGKGYVEMEKVHRDKKEYASKAVGGTALGLSIGALGLQLLGGGLLNCGLFGNRATVAETAAIAGTAANEHYLERKQCADQVQFVNDMWDPLLTKLPIKVLAKLISFLR